MNTPQFDAPPVKRRIPKTAIVLLVLFVFLGIVAFGWHLLTTTFAGAIGDGPEVTGSQTVAALPDALTGRLDHLEKMVRDLTDKISASIDTQTAIQNDVAALRERLDQEAAERVAAAKVAVAQRAALQRRRIVKPTPPPAPAPSAAVLSVDMWGGKPSVALRGPDGRVQFANTGDRIPGGGVIGSAQATGQTVTIRQADGSVSTVTDKDKP